RGRGRRPVLPRRRVPLRGRTDLVRRRRDRRGHALHDDRPGRECGERPRPPAERHLGRGLRPIPVRRAGHQSPLRRLLVADAARPVVPSGVHNGPVRAGRSTVDPASPGPGRGGGAVMRWLTILVLWVVALVVALVVLRRIRRGKPVLLTGRWSPM